MKLIKYSLTIIIPLIVSLVLHSLIMDITTLPARKSALVSSIGFEKSATLYFLLGFTLILLILILTRRRMKGSGLLKGISYSSIIGIMWITATVENSALLGSNPVNEFITGLFDFVPIMLIGLLSGFLILPDTESEARPRTNRTVLSGYFIRYYAITAVILLSGRLVIDRFLISCYGSTAMPGVFIVCSLILAAAVSAINLLIYGQERSGGRHTVILSFFIFGANWIFPVMWIPFIGEGFFRKFLCKLVTDIVLIYIGIYISSKLNPGITLIDKEEEN